MTEFNFASEDADDIAQSYRTADSAAEGLKQAVQSGKVRNELDADLRIFCSPTEPNTRFLAVVGTVVSFRDPASPTGAKDVRRDGDVWAEFTSGICATRDEEVISWCEAHSGDPELHVAYHQEKKTSARECEVDAGLCRDIDRDPNAAAWAEMKALQQPTARRSAQLPASMDIDRLFRRLPSAERELVAAGTSGNTSVQLTNSAAAAKNADTQRKAGK